MAAENDIVRVNDDAVASQLERQNTDPKSRWCGAVPDAAGLHQPGSAGGLLLRGMAALLHPSSKFRGDAELRRRLHLAAAHLRRVQTPDGNIDLLITNFNSPPDLAFVVLNVGPAALLARRAADREILDSIEPFLRRAGAALIRGGVHTPNHRWVVCAALAYLNALYPDAAFVRRIDQWLAEGIDIDEDGQYSEQSTAVYNAITNNALVTMALLLPRPELLAPVRRNLDATLYLLHPGGEIITAISHRQDRDTPGTLGAYWLSLRYLARADRNGHWEALARSLEPRYASLAHLMLFPELNAEAPVPLPPPDNYEQRFPHSGLVHIRRGPVSATISLTGASRFFTLRRGRAVIEAVRFAAAFFGKGQFIPTAGAKRGGRFRLEQDLEAGYYQPFDPPRRQPWGVESWYELREHRRRTEICRLRSAAEIAEVDEGFDLRLLAEGTPYVPVAVEINLRDGGNLEAVEPAGPQDAFLLPDGAYALYSRGPDRIRFGPGRRETRYTQIRGAQPKLPGPCVYLTAFTPFDHTIRFRWS